jgi:hypothetical protein
MKQFWNLGTPLEEHVNMKGKMRKHSMACEAYNCSTKKHNQCPSQGKG